MIYRKYIIFVVLGLLSNIAFAGGLSWSFATTDLDNPDANGESNLLDEGIGKNFIDDMELVYAYNMMYNGTIDFDGISFVGIDSDSRTGNDDIGIDGPIGAYAVFGASGTIQQTGFTKGAEWELKNLTVGNEYSVQVLIYDGRKGSEGRTVKFDEGAAQQYAFGTYENSSTGYYNQGLIATGTFTADDSSQTFNVTSDVDHSVSAIALFTTSSVPEPASYTMILSLGIFIFIRVFKHRKIA